MERFEENVSSEASDFEDESQDDGEEIGEQFSSDEEEIRPYQFEPELDENYPPAEVAEPAGLLRLLNTDW